MSRKASKKESEQAKRIMLIIGRALRYSLSSRRRRRCRLRPLLKMRCNGANSIDTILELLFFLNPQIFFLGEKLWPLMYVPRYTDRAENDPDGFFPFPFHLLSTPFVSYMSEMDVAVGWV